MAADQAVSPTHVRDVILKDLDRRTGEDGVWQIDGPPIRGRDSWIFKARTPLAPSPLAVKVYCDAVGADRSSHQAELLARYHDAMASRPSLTVPAPWAALPEHRTVIMQWVEEPRMDLLLRRAGRRRDERAQLFAAAARWLRHFHDQSGLSILPLNPAPLLQQIDVRLRGKAGAVPDRAFRSSCEILDRLAEEFAGTPIPHVLAHGDFVSHNLFHGPSGTVGFDLGGRHTAPISRDIFRFLVHAESEKPFLTRAGRLAPTGLERQDLDAFMAAYGPLDQPIEERLLTFLCFAEVLYRWAVLFDRLRRGRISLERVVKVVRLRRMAKYAIAALGAR